MRPDLHTLVRLPRLRSTALVMMDAFDDSDAEAPTPRQVLSQVQSEAAAVGYEPVFSSELEFYVFRPELSDQGFDAVFSRQSWFLSNALAITSQFTDVLGDTLRAMGIPVYRNFQRTRSWPVRDQPRAWHWSQGDRQRGSDENRDQRGRSQLGARRDFPGQADQPVGDASLRIPHAPDPACRGRQRIPRPWHASWHFRGGQELHGWTTRPCPRHDRHRSADRDCLQELHARPVGPVRAVWAVDNRTALIRAIPAGINTHVENRLGSADANPYLLAAVNVAAGLDGLAKQLDPGVPGEGNMFEDKRFAYLSTTLIEGVEAYADDRVLVDARGTDFSRIYTGVLRNDWKRFIEHVTDWEIREYREIL